MAMAITMAMAVGVCNFLFFMLSSASSLSFNLSPIQNIHQNTIIKIHKSAYISPQGIQVTQNDRGSVRTDTIGWGTYFETLHLWDKKSGELTDFDTHFTLKIDSSGNYDFGDGLAFFLAPNNSEIRDDSGGGAIGLVSGKDVLNSTVNHFVAVEFDTYPNPLWDPYKLDPPHPYMHVGINVNSMNSSVVARWYNNITQGRVNDIWITYNSSTKNLAVEFTGFWNNQNTSGRINHTIDLRAVLPEWVIFGFSASTGNSFEENNIKSWDFKSSSLQVDERRPAPDPQPPLPPTPPVVIVDPEGELNIALVVGVCVGLGCFIICGSGLIWCILRKQRRKKNMNLEVGDGDYDEDDVIDPSMENEFNQGTGPRKFTYSELSHSTNHFAEDAKLGEGGFGGVYKGFSKELNSFIAVKRVSKGSKQGSKEYASEIRIISRLRHRNLVQLIGWCHEKRELLLVYEFMPNCSLDFHLFKNKSLLSWSIRYKITQGLASALLYLHEEWEQCVVHRDIKSSNVMLDSNFNPKLGDFGLARLVDHEKGSQTTVLAGTMGYMAPECVITGRASKESDVYSFGIVALEIACGRQSIDVKLPEGQLRMVEWVWKLYGEGNILEAVDPKLCGDFEAKQMERLMIVGLWCVHPDDKLRPSIRQAIQVLNFEASLPMNLPSKMPIPTYLSLPLNMPTYSKIMSVSEDSQVQSSMGFSDNSADSSNITASSSSTSSSATAALMGTR